MRVRLNLPTALALHFQLSAVVMVATSCCSMYLKFFPTATAATPAVVCLPMSSVGVHAHRTYCCSHPVHTDFLVPQTYDDEVKKQEEGDTKWHGLWPQRSEHSGRARCGPTTLVHACSRGCLKISGRVTASAKSR